MAIELPWQKAGDSGQTHWGRFVGGTGKALSYHPVIGGPRAALGKGGPYQGVGHAFNLPAKANNFVAGAVKPIGTASDALRENVGKLGADFSRGLQNWQVDQSAAFGQALANVGTGAGAGVGGFAAYSLGGLAEGIGGGAATAASGLGEGVKSLAIPALLIIGALFLYKKVK